MAEITTRKIAELTGRTHEAVVEGIREQGRLALPLYRMRGDDETIYRFPRDAALIAIDDYPMGERIAVIDHLVAMEQLAEFPPDEKLKRMIADAMVEMKARFSQ